MRAIAAISSFFFTALAAWFGVALSPQKSSLVMTAAAILVVVLFNSTLHGFVFRRQAIGAMTCASALALVILWLPLLMYATSSWAAESALALTVLIVTSSAGAFIGALISAKVRRPE